MDGIKVVGVEHLTVRNQWYLVDVSISELTFDRSRKKNEHQNSSMRSAYRAKYWLSDPGSYPIIAILGGAMCFCTGFGLYFLSSAPDVQIAPAKRNAIMRDWK